jgi:hypothetical protein
MPVANARPSSAVVSGRPSGYEPDGLVGVAGGGVGKGLAFGIVTSATFARTSPQPGLLIVEATHCLAAAMPTT